jgi:hypothetical protein
MRQLRDWLTWLFGPPAWWAESDREGRNFRELLRAKIENGTSRFEGPAR